MGKDDSLPQKGDPTGTIRFADFSRQVFGPDFVLNGKKAKKIKSKLRRGASGADFRDSSEMSPEKRQFNATLRRSDANMRRVFATMNSFEQLEKIIQNKLFEKTGSGGMELLRLFRQIDKDKNMAIDIDEFREALIRFNINLEQRDIQRLFNHYDKSGTGAISYYEFIQHLLPGDFIPLEKLKSMGGIPGMSKRDVQRELLDAAAARAVNNARRGSVGLGDDRQIEKILRDKIMTNLSSGPYELVRMFRMFDLDGNGSIDYHEFKEVFTKFNIIIPDSQLLNLFKKYDKSGTGNISYYDFLHHVLPADFPDVGDKAPETGFATMGADSRTNNVALRNPHFAKAEKRATKYVKNAFKGHGDFSMLERILRSKIVEKTKSGGAELLRLFRQFDKDGNQAIDRDEFKATLKIYNLDLEDDDVDMMFKRYDQDKDGFIDYYEFIQHLLPDDFIPLEKLKSMGGLPGMTSTDHSKQMLKKAAQVAERNVRLGNKGLAIHDQAFVRTLLKDKVMMKTKGGARELWNAFRHFDKDGSGDIDFDEFYHVVVRHYNIDLPRAEVQAMFQEFLDRRVFHSGKKKGKGAVVETEAMSGGEGKTEGAALKNDTTTTTKASNPNPQLGTTQAWEDGFEATVNPPKKEYPKLRRIVKRKWRLMLRDFSSIDTVDTGYASRAETRFVLGKYNVSISDQHLTSLIPTHANGLIEYRKFLSSFGAPLEGVRNVGLRLAQERPSSSVAQSAAARQNNTGGVSKGTDKAVRALRAAYLANHEKGYKRHSSTGSSSTSRPSSAAWSFPNELNQKLKTMMAKKWKLVSNALRGQDTRRKKSLHGGTFRRTLARFGVNLNESDMKHLRHKFGEASHASGKQNLSIDYVGFLNHYAAGSAALSARSRRFRPRSAAVTRARLTKAYNYRPSSSLMRKSASYQPSSRQMEASLTAHVRKALQIANAPADRRALKAALATARSGGSLTQRSSGLLTNRSMASRSRALSRGAPGTANSSHRPMSAPRTFRRSASASSTLNKHAMSTKKGRNNMIVGPSIRTTNRRDLGDHPNPTGGAKNRASYRGPTVSRDGLMGRGNLMMSRTINLDNTIGLSKPPSARSEQSMGSLFASETKIAAPSASEIKKVCAALKLQLQPCWKELRGELKNADVNRSGTVRSRVFRSLLAKYDVSMSEDQFFIVVSGFARGEEVKYDPFLRMCLR